MNLMFKIHFILVFILSVLSSFGQNSIEIKAPTLTYENEKLYVSFDLSNKAYSYEINIEIINSSGVRINANAFSGDIGPNIQSGNNKSVIWNLKQDGIFLDETISVKVIAKLSPRVLNRGKLIVQSTIWPGWGQSKVKNGKPYWIIGVAGTACIAGSYIYNQKSNDSYDKYILEIDANRSKEYYDQAVQQDNTSKVLAYSAAGIWAANIIWVAFMPNKIETKKLSLHLLPMNLGTHHTSVSLGLRLNL